MDVLYALLLKNKIKIGEANLEKSKLLSNLRQEYSTASQNLANRYIQQINQEIQAAQADWAQRRAIASQYLMNQQQINSRQYQAPMPYQMPPLRAPAPKVQIPKIIQTQLILLQ